ncbi:MAG: hypothetical protein ISS19_06360 [Bacteroidales bacterium]|nr:hypothetical protein [Bacteroidales bacterium]
MNAEPYIFFAGIRIDEPVTTITDLVVAGICIYAFSQLIKNYRPSKERTFFCIFFLGLGIGTLLGGLLGHAFLYRLHPAWQLPGWLLSMVAISSLVLASLEIIRKFIHSRLVYLIALLNIIVFLILGIMATNAIDFIYVVIQIAFSLLGIIFFLHLYGWFKSKDPGHLLFIAAVSTMIFTALIFLMELNINQWINHNSISHSLMALSALLFYQGARRFLINPVNPS